MKEIVSKGIAAAGLVIAALIISQGLNAAVIKKTTQTSFQLVANGSVMYRLEKNNGRVDIIIPAVEGAYIVPVMQMNPQMDSGDKMSAEEQEKWSKISAATAQYLRLSQGMAPAAAEKESAGEDKK